jgi:iron complex transport system substrate-binding protein
VRIASLQPFATDILTRCGVGLNLVAVTHLCQVPKSSGRVAAVTRPSSEPFTYVSDDDRRLAQGISTHSVDLKQLYLLQPDILIADIQDSDVEGFVAWAEERMRQCTGQRVRVFNSSITSLAQMGEIVEEVGGFVGGRAEARVLAGKTQAQLMAWADSFFERCKGKRVVVLSSVQPIVVAERWIPDLVQMTGAKYLERDEKLPSKSLAWQDILASRPDVIVVAPEGASLAESVRMLRVVQELPQWETIPAVKRGEVIFCAGTDMYRPGAKFLRGAAVLVSAIAGLDSGYITERDEYFKIRYLELHRHKFL